MGRLLLLDPLLDNDRHAKEYPEASPFFMTLDTAQSPAVRLSHRTSAGVRGSIDVPQLGLGVFKIAAGGSARQAVAWALEAGYRHIDTAKVYENEEDVGRAIAESNIPRKELHVTTKLWTGDQGYDQARAALDASLKRLGLDYVDLYLVHAPPEPASRADTWRAMEDLLDAGKARAIGVSNYGIHHLKELFASARIYPCTNQVELSPFLQRRELVDFCRNHGVELTAYSPLTRGQRLDDQRLNKLATDVGKTPAQVLIRWGIEEGYLVIPKSSNRGRIRENLDVWDFDLGPEALRSMRGWDEDYVSGWDPTRQP